MSLSSSASENDGQFQYIHALIHCTPLCGGKSNKGRTGKMTHGPWLCCSLQESDPHAMLLLFFLLSKDWIVWCWTLCFGGLTCTFNMQGDAKAAAAEAEVHIHYVKGEKERIIAERREKARLRHKYAREKELLKLVGSEKDVQLKFFI